jgi:hypothetical protein
MIVKELEQSADLQIRLSSRRLEEVERLRREGMDAVYLDMDDKAFINSLSIEVEQWYAEGGLDFMRQVSDGRMGYIGTIRDDVPFVLGRPSLTFREWASFHKDEFIELASGSSTI